MYDNEKYEPGVWIWYIFSYNPKDPYAISYVSTGYKSGKLRLNLAHRMAYLYLAVLLSILGMVLYVMVTGNSPYDKITDLYGKLFLKRQ